MFCCCCTVLYCCYTVVHESANTYCPAVPDTHTALVTHTPRPCDVTGLQKRLSSNPRLCFFLFPLYSCTVHCCAIVHAWWVGCWWVDGAIAVQQYCCYTVLLLLSPAAARSPGRSRRRSRRRSRAATVARASLGCRRRSPAVARSLDRSLARSRSPVVARPPLRPSLERPLAAVVARPPSPARSLARASFVRSPAVARPPSLLLSLARSYQIMNPSALQYLDHHGVGKSTMKYCI